MTMKLPTLLAVSALLAAPLAAQAVTYQFNASLKGANEVPANASPGSGLASLSYDDMGTVGLGDDVFSFTSSASGMTGSATLGHIHLGAAGFTGPPIVALSGSPSFFFFTAPAITMVGNLGPVPAPAGFLSALMASGTYVNLHTVAFSSGEIRGQLLPVGVVPEPSTYALMLAGIGMMGMLARRRRG